jgi:hypothetical protein
MSKAQINIKLSDAINDALIKLTATGKFAATDTGTARQIFEAAFAQACKKAGIEIAETAPKAAKAVPAPKAPKVVKAPKADVVKAPKAAKSPEREADAKKIKGAVAKLAKPVKAPKPVKSPKAPKVIGEASTAPTPAA